MLTLELVLADGVVVGIGDWVAVASEGIEVGGTGLHVGAGAGVAVGGTGVGVEARAIGAGVGSRSSLVLKSAIMLKDAISAEIVRD